MNLPNQICRTKSWTACATVPTSCACSRVEREVLALPGSAPPEVCSRSACLGDRRGGGIGATHARPFRGRPATAHPLSRFFMWLVRRRRSYPMEAWNLSAAVAGACLARRLGNRTARLLTRGGGACGQPTHDGPHMRGKPADVASFSGGDSHWRTRDAHTRAWARTTHDRATRDATLPTLQSSWRPCHGSSRTPKPDAWTTPKTATTTADLSRTHIL